MRKSFHPLSILPKSFQGKYGKVLAMPSLEKFLEWLLRKHPIFASHCATSPPLCVELWSRSLNAFPLEKFVKLSSNFHPLTMNIYEATWFSCIPWDCCRQHIMKAIQQPLLNLIHPSSLFCAQNYHPICPTVFLVPLSITPAPNQLWGITIRIIYKENAQPSDSNLFGLVLDLQLSATNCGQRQNHLPLLL